MALASTAGGAVLSAFMQVVFEKAFTASCQEIELVRGAHKELNKLSGTLHTIQAVLEDAEEKQIKDSSVRSWLRNLKDIAYDADDLLDEFAAKELQSIMEVDGVLAESQRERRKASNTIVLPASCICSNDILYRRRMARRVKAIRERLDDIAKDRDSLRLRELGNTTRLEILKRMPTSSLIDASLVFGRDDDREKIVRMLVPEEPGSMDVSLSVVAIVGLGGIGKTTLAQLVYNDERVQAHFKLKMWVHVSQSYNLSMLTRAIIENATRRKFELNDLNMLQEGLKKALKGKRFLLVLDDVWNENRTEWERLCLPLAAGGRGSKIVITTRNKRVAQITSTMEPYFLEGLQHDACWDLFCKFAFAGGESHTNSRINLLGQEIIMKLKGLPLAAKTLGSLLYSNTDENEWENILQSEIWELASHANEILPALRLSYQNLPPHLKQCFSYCSTFPKGYEFDKDKLIKIWIALGFVRPERRKRLEDIGAEYFDDLLCRSFFQYFKESYVMHDMVHALAHSVSVDECYTVQDDWPINVHPRIRHVALSSNSSMPNVFEAFYGCRGLRTLVALQGFNSHTFSIPRDLFLQLRYLRVLDLSGSSIRDLPDSIGKLKLLRYLDLSATSLERLPECITTLYNLQSLKLMDCFMLHELPSGMSNLIKLQHLEADSKLVSEIAGIGKLTCLQELQKFMVREEDGFRITELKDMTELRGRLLIWKLENVVSVKDAREARLSTKQNLQALELDWAPDRRGEGIDEEVLECLQPYTNLKELNIDGYNGVKFPSWIGNQLFRSLVKIYFYYCRKCELLPPLGQLRYLKELTIHGMHGVKQIGREFSGHGSVNGFPSLEVLCFEDMLQWEEWTGIEEGQFSRLRELIIKDCPRLRVLPNLPPSVKMIEISNAGLCSLPGIWGCKDMRPHSSSSSSSAAAATSSSSSSSSSSMLVPSLSNLYLFNCPNLTSMREGLFQYNLRDLRSMTIWKCEELASFPEGGFEGLYSLTSLVIEDCSKLKSLPEAGGLPSSLVDLRIISCPLIDNSLFSRELGFLSSLHISDCPSLTMLPAGLTMLETLEVHHCHELTVIAEEALRPMNSLKHLEIEDCPKLTSVRVMAHCGLPESLQVLKISSCSDASSWVFEGLGSLASLQYLHIADCLNLKSLPEGLYNLEHLRSLHVHNCPQITAFPNDGLPIVLEFLSIWECPKLKESCQKETGTDWDKIAYIPTIMVDGQKLT